MLLLGASTTSVAQQQSKNILNMFELQQKDLPEGYQFTEVLNCKTAQVNSFFKNIDLYRNDIGTVAFKGFQSIESKNDSGSILYFQFQDPKNLESFLNDYLWGKDGEASNKRPERYMILANNYLIIWSVELDSPITEISRKKINSLL